MFLPLYTEKPQSIPLPNQANLSMRNPDIPPYHQQVLKFNQMLKLGLSFGGMLILGTPALANSEPAERRTEVESADATATSALKLEAADGLETTATGHHTLPQPAPEQTTPSAIRTNIRVLSGPAPAFSEQTTPHLHAAITAGERPEAPEAEVSQQSAQTDLQTNRLHSSLGTESPSKPLKLRPWSISKLAAANTTAPSQLSEEVMTEVEPLGVEPIGLAWSTVDANTSRWLSELSSNNEVESSDLESSRQTETLTDAVTAEALATKQDDNVALDRPTTLSPHIELEAEPSVSTARANRLRTLLANRPENIANHQAELANPNSADTMLNTLEKQSTSAEVLGRADGDQEAKATEATDVESLEIETPGSRGNRRDLLSEILEDNGVVAQSYPVLDDELGTLRLVQVRSRNNEDLGILRLLQTAEAAPPPPRSPIAFLGGRLGFVNVDNVFRSPINSIEEQIYQAGVSISLAPKLSENTSLYGIIETNIARYNNFSEVNYNEVQFQVGVRQRLLPRTYAQVGWRNQRLYSPGYREKLFGIQYLNALVSHRAILTPKTWVDGFYQMRLGFADPQEASRFRQTLTLSLNYGVSQDLRTSLLYQLDFDDYTQIERFDTYQQILGIVSYNITPESRISVFGGTRFGNSSANNINLDDTFYGAGLNVNVPLF